MRTLSRVGLAAAILGACAVTTCAADWNQWRGPDRSGIAPDSPKLLDVWGKKGPAQVWASEPIPGGADGGWSSPVVANGKVYLFVNWKRFPDKGVQDVVLCLDARTGVTLWKVNFPGREYGWGTSSSVGVFDGKVVAVGGKDMYCLDAETGKEIWKVEHPGNELSSCPTVVDGVVVVCTGLLKGYDLATGKELWSCNDAGRGNGNNTSPGVWKTKDKTYVVTNMGQLTLVDPKDGKAIWRGDRADCAATPDVTGDICVVGAGVAAYKLALDKPEKLFSNGLGDRGASQVVYKDNVYCYNGGGMRCFDLKGNKLWEQGLGGEIASLVLADGKLYLVTGDNSLYIFAATPTKPEQFYQIRIPVQGLTTSAIADGKLYVRLRNGVGCYDLTQEAKPKPGEIDRAAWAATSVTGPAQQVVEGNGERWSTGRAMKPEDWLQIDMLKAYKLAKVTMDSAANPNDAAQGLQVLTSLDGKDFTKVAELSLEQCKQAKGLFSFTLPNVEARYIKFVQMGANGPSWWSVNDVRVDILPAA